MFKYTNPLKAEEMRRNLDSYLNPECAKNYPFPQWKWDRIMAAHIIADVLGTMTLNEDDENDDYSIDMDVGDHHVKASLTRK